MAEPEMANVPWGQGQRQPHNTAGSQWGEHSEKAQCWYLVKHSPLWCTPPSLGPVRALCILSCLTPCQVCKATNREGPCGAEGLFPDPTGANTSSSQHGTSLTNFLLSIFQATVLTSAFIWGC